MLGGERADALQRIAEHHRQAADRIILDAGPGRESLKLAEGHTLIASAIHDALSTEDPGFIVSFADQVLAAHDERLKRWREQMPADERAAFEKRLAEEGSP